MSNILKTITVGVNTLDGLGHIILLDTSLDEGHHLTAVMPVNIDYRIPSTGKVVSTKFSYFNKFTNNSIYREIEEE